MSTDKKSFVLYTDSIPIWERLSDEQAGKLIKAIYSYVLGNEMDIEDPIIDMASLSFRQHLDRDMAKWERTQTQRKEAAKASVASRQKKKEIEKKSTSVNERPTETNMRSISLGVNDTVTDTVNGTVIISNYKEKEFIENWSKCRKHFLGKPTNFKNLDNYEQPLFAESIKSFSKEEINEAMQGLFKQKTIDFDSMLLRPKHFLNNIPKYLEAELSKTYYLYGNKSNKQAL